jgi:hypothetical protein
VADVTQPSTVDLRDLIDWDSSLALKLDLQEFDGPATTSIGMTPYVTLTQFGVKEVGQPTYPDNGTRHWDRAEAVFHFKRVFWEYYVANVTDDVRQLAWRDRPKAEQSADGDWIVRCRFALLETPKNLAVPYPFGLKPNAVSVA